ncbi:MAG: sigma-70 family RNA polymerase sigma factor, partial [Caldilineaceae bacterium]|nr:sigma-70 family RNA polymerase sigma factor [Caldilineaceae bacterium]
MLTEAFEDYRNLLFSIAYRMLGSVMEAEDAVQEAYLRFMAADVEEVVSYRAYLITIVTRICLDQLKSARVRREQYVGPWLPEPLETADEPSVVVQSKETITLAFLTLLEKLPPVERAAFLLRE